MAENHYMPQTKADWTSNNASSQFKLWRKEVERKIGGPLASRSDRVKTNIYIWAGAHAESLIEARLNEDPELRITTPTELLDQLAKCLTHSTLFREKREEFYTARQKIDENTTSYYSRLLDLNRQAEFPENTNFLIVDKLIHGCISKDCKRKLMAKGASILLNRLNWDDLSTRRKKLKAKLMFQIIKGLSPAYLQDLFSIRSTKYNLRESEIKLNMPKPRTNYCKRALGYSGALLWNSLPVNLRKSDSLGYFKRELDKFLQ